MPNERGDIGKRLIEARELAGLTQARAAELLGVTTTTLGNYERGQREPGAKIIADATSLYVVSPAWLLIGEGLPYPPEKIPANQELFVLKPDEAALLDNYRNSPESAKQNMRAVGAAFAQQAWMKDYEKLKEA